MSLYLSRAVRLLGVRCAKANNIVIENLKVVRLVDLVSVGYILQLRVYGCETDSSCDGQEGLGGRIRLGGGDD